MLLVLAVWHSTTRAQSGESYGRLPLSFEPDAGQAKFLSRGRDCTLLLSPTEVAFPGVRMRFAGAHPASRLEGIDPLPGRSHYYMGSDARQWRTNVPHYARVRLQGLYPGVDLVYYGNQRQLEYDLMVAPGADPRRIRLAFEGAEEIGVDGQENLWLRTARGTIVHRKAAAWQEVDGRKKEVAVRYILLTRNEVGFDLGAYDAGAPLVIDPVLVYSSYLGGSSNDNSGRIAVDGSGSAYIVGTTASSDFPATPGILPSGGVFVVKLNPAGTALVYSTFLSGGRGQDIAVDATGNAYITGEATAPSFPTTPGAFRTSHSLGIFSAYAAKLSATGALVYSTYLGGQAGYGIAVDVSGNAYVSGTAFSPEFPATPGAFQRTIAGGNDAFVTKLNATGSALVYSTLLGGSAGDEASRIAVDVAGNAYLTGAARSDNFPTTPGALQRTHSGGNEDAFIAKLNPTGTALAYSTLLGGRGPEGGFDIRVDAAGNTYVTGLTYSSDFPTTPGALQRSKGAGEAPDAFVAKLNPAGSALVYSTFLGGNGADGASGVSLDSFGNTYVTGQTCSSSFPITPGAIQTALRGNCDAFVTKLNASGAGVLYSTYLGGGDSDSGTGIAADFEGNAYVAGETLSFNFPITPGVIQTAGFSSGPGGDIFIAKISDATASGRVVTSLSAASFGFVLAAESIASAFGQGLATNTQSAAATPLPTALDGTTVRVTDSAGTERPAPLFYVSPGQINYLVPAGTRTGPATVTVTAADGAVSTGRIQVEAVAPGLFTANANGEGVAAAVVVRARADGSQSSEVVFQFDPVLNRQVSLPIDFGPETDQLVLVLFGTGLRGRSALAGVRVRIAGREAEVLYAGPQGAFVGLDQVNVGLPRRLAGFREVPVTLIVDGKPANSVIINVK